MGLEPSQVEIRQKLIEDDLLADEEIGRASCRERVYVLV